MRKVADHLQGRLTFESSYSRTTNYFRNRERTPWNWMYGSAATEPASQFGRTAVKIPNSIILRTSSRTEFRADHGIYEVRFCGRKNRESLIRSADAQDRKPTIARLGLGQGHMT